MGGSWFSDGPPLLIVLILSSAEAGWFPGRQIPALYSWCAVSSRDGQNPASTDTKTREVPGGRPNPFPWKEQAAEPTTRIGSSPWQGDRRSRPADGYVAKGK